MEDRVRDAQGGEGLDQWLERGAPNAISGLGAQPLPIALRELGQQLRKPRETGIRATRFEPHLHGCRRLDLELARFPRQGLPAGPGEAVFEVPLPQDPSAVGETDPALVHVVGQRGRDPVWQPLCERAGQGDLVAQRRCRALEKHRTAAGGRAVDSGPAPGANSLPGRGGSAPQGLEPTSGRTSRVLSDGRAEAPSARA